MGQPRRTIAACGRGAAGSRPATPVGDKYAGEKPPRILRRKADKKRVVAALVPKGTEVLTLDEVDFVPGPGLTEE